PASIDTAGAASRERVSEKAEAISRPSVSASGTSLSSTLHDKARSVPVTASGYSGAWARTNGHTPGPATATRRRQSETTRLDSPASRTPNQQRSAYYRYPAPATRPFTIHAGVHGRLHRAGW